MDAVDFLDSPTNAVPTQGMSADDFLDQEKTLSQAQNNVLNNISTDPSLGHTAGVAARSLANGVVALPLAAMDAGATIPHALGWLYNKLSPDDWQKLTLNPSISSMLNQEETALGAPEAKNNTEKYLGAAATGAGAVVGGGGIINGIKSAGETILPSAAEGLMNAYRGIVGGLSSQAGSDVGGEVGKAVAPKGDIAGYTGEDIGSIVGGTAGATAGGSLANRAVPTSPQAGMTALMENGVPVSVAQVGGSTGLNRLATSTPFTGVPLRTLAQNQSTAVQSALDKVAGGMNAEEAGQAIQEAAKGAQSGALTDKANELYADYNNAVAHPVIDAQNGAQAINPLGKPAVTYPSFTPDKSIAGAQFLLQNDPGNPAAQATLQRLAEQQKDGSYDPIRRDTNSANSVKSDLQAASQDAYNKGNTALGSHYANMAQLVNQDIIASNESAVPGSAALKAEADANFPPIAEARESLRPLANPAKDESATTRLMQGIGAQKQGNTLNTDTNMVRSLFGNNPPEVTNPIAAYILRTIGEPTSAPNTKQSQAFQIATLGKYLQNTKENNPDIYNALTANGSASGPLGPDFLSGIQHIGENPIQGNGHISLPEAAGGSVAAIEGLKHLYEKGLTSGDALKAALGSGSIAGVGNIYSAINANQGLSRLYNQVPRGKTSLADTLKQQLPVVAQALAGGR